MSCNNRRSTTHPRSNNLDFIIQLDFLFYFIIFIAQEIHEDWERANAASSSGSFELPSPIGKLFMFFNFFNSFFLNFVFSFIESSSAMKSFENSMEDSVVEVPVEPRRPVLPGHCPVRDVSWGCCWGGGALGSPQHHSSQKTIDLVTSSPSTHGTINLSSDPEETLPLDPPLRNTLNPINVKIRVQIKYFLN